MSEGMWKYCVVAVVVLKKNTMWCIKTFVFKIKNWCGLIFSKFMVTITNKSREVNIGKSDG